MKRRQLIAGIGAAVAGGGAALGTGAFTSVEADRSVSVNVASEDQAYLALDPNTGSDNEDFSTAPGSGNELELDFNGPGGVTGDGPGLDSVYKFDSVFQVKNQGTQKVYVSVSSLSLDGGNVSIEFYAGSDSSTPLDSNDLELDTGDTPAEIGVKIDINENASIDSFSGDTTVSASSSSDDNDNIVTI